MKNNKSTLTPKKIKIKKNQLEKCVRSKNRFPSMPMIDNDFLPEMIEDCENLSLLIAQILLFAPQSHIPIENIFKCAQPMEIDENFEDMNDVLMILQDLENYLPKPSTSHATVFSSKRLSRMPSCNSLSADSSQDTTMSIGGI